MKNAIIAFGIVAAAKLAAAQSACLSLTSEFPACAFTCVSSAANAVGCTNTADLACQCNPQSSAAIQNSAINCVLACGGDAAASALKAATDICNCVATATSASSSSSTSSSTLPSGNSATPTSTTTSASTGSGSGSSSPPPTTSCPPTTTSTCTPATTPSCGSIISQIPGCAQPCFISAGPQVHCSVGDYACQCQPDAQASLSPILKSCIATACPLDSSTLASIKTGASSLCACATAPVTGGDCSPTTTPTTSVSTTPCSSGGGGTETQTTTVQSVATVTSCSEGCGGQPTQPGGGGSTPPVVVPTGAGSRHGVGRVGDFIGAFWFAAVAL